MATVGSETSRVLGLWLCLAVFFARLLVTLAYPPHTLLDRGLIPIVADWSLAVFVYLVAATPGETPGEHAIDGF